MLILIFLDQNNLLSKTNWEFFDVNDDIYIITDMFTNKFIDVAKSTIPNKECIIRGKDKPPTT